MALEMLDRLNRRFSGWHERLFGHVGQRELRPQDILRRIVAEMDSHRRKGLDGLWYVPNVFTLQVAVGSEDERQYLRTFLGAEELVNAVAQEIEGRNYRVKGMLLFTVEEVAPAVLEQRIRIVCRFDPDAKPDIALPVVEPARPSVPAPVVPSPGSGEDEEPGTVAAIGPHSQAVATLEIFDTNGAVCANAPVTLAGVRIGRSKRENNDVILLGDPQVSKRHAAITYEQGRFVIYDLGSTNGTIVRGARIPQHQPVPISFDEELRVGSTTIRLRQQGKSVSISEPPPAYPALPVGSLPDGLLVRLIGGDGTVYTLASEMTVGRGVTEDIVLHGNGISLKHARLSQRSGAFYVEDLSTPGGTFVNGERIPANFPVALYNGDQVAFGETLFRVERVR